MCFYIGLQTKIKLIITIPPAFTFVDVRVLTSNILRKPYTFLFFFRGYIETNCTVTESGMYGNWQNCSCGLNCTSQIPCGRVSYHLLDNAGLNSTPAVFTLQHKSVRYYTTYQFMMTNSTVTMICL